ncbi:MAG: hypothetical protein ACLGHP_08380 [Vicinamibacteria bacterium]
MCGIGGLVRFGVPAADPGVARRLLDALAHRGPDGSGTYLSPSAGACLAHCRLAIIAPGDEGRQPMTTADERYWLVFNGEIYNYRELRQALGGEFRTGSDAEVLLRLVIAEGPAGLARLRGMFAFALWDEAEGRLLVARDRFGIKPLYVAATPAHVAFASEARALVDAGLVSRRASAAGVLAYLRWAAIPPPLTWLDGVEALLALAAAPRERLTRTAYNLGAFNPSAEEVRDEVLKAFPDARITWNTDVKRQGIVDSWPADVDDAAARRDWGFNPTYDFARAFQEYLIPTIRARYHR